MRDFVYQTLERFGLSEKEILVYRAVLKHEETTPFELSRETKIPRTTVYDVLTGLALKGLLTIKEAGEFEKQQTKIRAKNPATLREIITKRKHELQKLEVDIVDVLSPLVENFQGDNANASVEFYPGVLGARKILLRRDPMNTKQETYVWNYLMPMNAIGKKTMNDLIDKEIEIRKSGGGERAKNIIPLNKWTKHVLSYQYGRDNGYLLRNEFRYIENSAFSLRQEIYIREGSVSIICVEDDEAWGMVLHSSSFAKTFRSIFELTWERAVPVTEAFVKSLGENEFLKAEQGKKGKG